MHIIKIKKSNQLFFVDKYDIIVKNCKIIRRSFYVFEL